MPRGARLAYIYTLVFLLHYSSDGSRRKKKEASLLVACEGVFLSASTTLPFQWRLAFGEGWGEAGQRTDARTHARGGS